jgi:hypothetical protein
VRFLLSLAVLLSAGLALGAPAPARTSCTAGVRTVGGVTYRTFCGSARATVTAGATHLAFAGGECSKEGGAFSVNIGTITLPPGKPKYTYFGLTVFTTHAGTFKSPAPAVGWQLPGGKRGSILYATVTIAPGMKRGSFTGKLLGPNTPAHGSFTC